MMIHRIASRLRRLEEQAASDEASDQSGVRIYIPDNGRGDGPRVIDADKVVIYKPSPRASEL